MSSLHILLTVSPVQVILAHAQKVNKNLRRGTRFSSRMRSWSTIRPPQLRPVWPAHFPHCAREWHSSCRMRIAQLINHPPIQVTPCVTSSIPTLSQRMAQLLAHAQLINHPPIQVTPCVTSSFPTLRKRMAQLLAHAQLINHTPIPVMPCVISSFPTLRKRMARWRLAHAQLINHPPIPIRPVTSSFPTLRKRMAQ